MKKREYLRLFFCISLVLICVLFSSAAEANESEYFVSDGEDVSYMLDNPNFSMYRQFATDQATYIQDNIFPGGIIRYSDRGGYAGDSYLYGLMDSDGTILLQPQYTSIDPFRICHLFEEQTEEVETSFPNLLILVDEKGKQQLFDCRTKEIVGDSYDMIGIEEDHPDHGYYSNSGNYNMFEYFIPVYNKGKGYGMLNLEGELIIPCKYDSYDPKHALRMGMRMLDAEGRIMEEHLYSETGTLLNASSYTIWQYHNGMAAAQKKAASDSGQEIYGYLDFYGNWAFTLGEDYTNTNRGTIGWPNLAQWSGDIPYAFSGEGLVQIEFYDKERDVSYPVYMNRHGQVMISLAWLYDASFIDADYYYKGSISTSDFHNGMALVTVGIWSSANVYDYDRSVQYILYTDGTYKKLSSEMYYVEDNGCIFVKENRDAEEYINVFGRWGFNVLPQGDYSVDFCCDDPDCEWVEIIDNTTNLAAYLSLAEWRLTDFLYDPSRGSCQNYLGEEYLLVYREGKSGYLGANAQELVPCEYSHVQRPLHNTGAYFRATSSNGYVTLYSLKGDLISKHEQFTNFYTYDDYTYHTVGCAMATDRDTWKPAIVDSTGNITIVKENGGFDVNSDSFVSGLAYATRSYDNGEEWVTESGFITADGHFESLSLVGHDFCKSFIVTFDPELPYGVGAIQHEHYETEDGIPDAEIYLLRYNNYTFDGWYDTTLHGGSSPIVKVESITPANGELGVNENTKRIDIKFNQEILLMNENSVKISCPFNTPKYYLSCEGDTLSIILNEPLEFGERYTIELDDLAVASAHASISTFDGYTSTFKVFGLSREELLTKYPQYLETPNDIAIKTDIALCAANNAMDRYAGENNISAYIASFYYATQNYHEISMDQFWEAHGGSGHGSKLWGEVLQAFIAKTCLENEQKYKQMNQLTKSELRTFIRMFDVKGAQEDVVKQLRDFVDDANFDIGDKELDAIAEGLKKLAYEPEFLKQYLNIVGEFSDVAGEFAATFLTYYYLNIDTAETLLKYLPEESELYCGLKDHVDALKNGDTFLFLMEKLTDKCFASALKIGMKEMGKFEAELLGSADALKGINLVLDVAHIFYTAASDRAEITEYIKTIMFSSYVFSMDTALDDLRIDMMASVEKRGSTTAQQREDFAVLYRTYQACWILFLDQAGALFKEEGNHFYQECMTAKAILEEGCDFESFLDSCKRAVPDGVVREILAQESSEKTTTVTGFLSWFDSIFCKQVTPSFHVAKAEEPIVLQEETDAPVLQSSLDDIYVDTLNELLAWVGYEPNTMEEYSRALYVTGNIEISEAGEYRAPDLSDLVICEGASLTIGPGVTWHNSISTSVYGTITNHGVFDAFGIISVLPSETGSSSHGAFYNHGTLNCYGIFSTEPLTRICNTGEMVIENYCAISGEFEGNEPTGDGTIEWPMRPYQVPDSYDALVEMHVSLLIPGILNGKNVSAVADNAFAEDMALQYVTVEGNADGTVIGSSAFRDCPELQYVTLGNVTSIGDHAFSGCAIECVLIPASVTNIGAGAFEGVEVIFGFTAVAEEHAASIGAAYVDVSRTATELEIISLPNKTTFSVGEDMDLAGLVLSSGGKTVSLDDCCIEALPAAPGNYLIHIQYLDAYVTLPVEVKYAAAYGNNELELLSIVRTEDQKVQLRGKATTEDENRMVFIAFYKENGQMLNVFLSTPDETGIFEEEYPVTDVGSLRIFLVASDSNCMPLTPCIDYQLS